MTQQRYEYEKQMLADFPKGAVVRVKESDGYVASVASKIRDRLGEVTGHQIPTPNPIITFYAVGRKKEHRMVFAHQPGRDLEVITDVKAINKWRGEVAAKAARK